MLSPFPLGSSSLPTDGSLRLVGGDSSQSGRLEIQQNKMWLSVCGSRFTAEAAEVACRQLGFAVAANYCTNAWYVYSGGGGGGGGGGNVQTLGSAMVANYCTNAWYVCSGGGVEGGWSVQTLGFAVAPMPGMYIVRVKGGSVQI